MTVWIIRMWSTHDQYLRQKSDVYAIFDNGNDFISMYQRRCLNHVMILMSHLLGKTLLGCQATQRPSSCSIARIASPLMQLLSRVRALQLPAARANRHATPLSQFHAHRAFHSLGLNAELVHRLAERGMTEPTAAQEQVLAMLFLESQCAFSPHLTLCCYVCALICS